jgi:hypothetical protein
MRPILFAAAYHVFGQRRTHPVVRRSALSASGDNSRSGSGPAVKRWRRQQCGQRQVCSGISGRSGTRPPQNAQTLRRPGSSHTARANHARVGPRAKEKGRYRTSDLLVVCKLTNV